MSDQRINLNLDTIEAPIALPYVFSIGSQTFSFTDPRLLDWQEIEHLSTIDAMAEKCMSDEDREAFYKEPLAAFKLNLLFDDVMRHFKMGPYAEQSRRR